MVNAVPHDYVRGNGAECWSACPGRVVSSLTAYPGRKNGKVVFGLAGSVLRNNRSRLGHHTCRQ